MTLFQLSSALLISLIEEKTSSSLSISGLYITWRLTLISDKAVSCFVAEINRRTSNLS